MLDLSENEAFKLRDYQNDLIQQTFKAWSSGQRRTLLQLPTGGGKTVIFSAIAKTLLQQGERVLVLAHRKEIITQAHSKLEAISGLKAGLLKAGMPCNLKHPIQVASIQTIRRRKEVPEASLVICDEAHHATAASYANIFERYPNAYILGVTATPSRTDGKPLDEHFDELISGPSVSWLIKHGYLCPFKLYTAAKLIDTRGIGLCAGDFNLSALSDAINTNQINGDVVATWKKFAEGKRTVVFAVDVEHSQNLALAFRKAGVAAEHLDGSFPDRERDAVLQRFRSGETGVLVNCALISEGFDVPGIEVIQCVRPTRSLIFWLQTLGRALRPAPGKDYALIIDQTENWKYHGLPDSERCWSLSRNVEFQLPTLINCSDCGHVYQPTEEENSTPKFTLSQERERRLYYIATCPECGHEEILRTVTLPISEAAPKRELIEASNEEMVEVNRDLKRLDGNWTEHLIHFLRQVQLKRGYKRGWIYYQLLEHPRREDFSLDDWKYFASVLGYKPGWAWHQWRKIQEDSSLFSQLVV